VRYSLQSTYFELLLCRRRLEGGWQACFRSKVQVVNSAVSDALRVTEQHWLVVCEQARHELAEQPLTRGLVRLRSWPDLTDVPDQLLEPVIRICALLWSKPAASYLIARAINGEPRQTAVLLRTLQVFGHVELMAATTERGDEERLAAGDGGEPQAARSSFIGKLWQRLLG
jgi:hypothetical protein